MNIVNVGYDSTNYYVLGNKNCLLVDIGFPGSLPKLLSACKRKSISLAEIKYLLVTHYHPDHGGLAQELKQAGVRLVVLENQLAWIPVMARYMKPGQQYQEIDLRDNLVLCYEDSRKFLSGLGLAGEIISTQGHSEDSLSLVLDEGLAFTGDLPMLGFADDPEGLIRQSWERLRLKGVKDIYPGHGAQRPLALSL